MFNKSGLVFSLKSHLSEKTKKKPYIIKLSGGKTYTCRY